MTGHSPGPRIAVITVVAGRHHHLRRQLDGIASAPTKADDHVIVAMNDETVHDIAREYPATRVVDLTCDPAALELARARNLGAHNAIRNGAELLVFLDVDCIPGPHMLDRYRRAAVPRSSERLLFCGPVTYLDPEQTGADLTHYTNPHPARPAPHDGEVVIDPEMTLFWSLSFAVTAASWRALGGFHTDYRGYGGEDTDFAMIASTKGFQIAWVGGAHAYHQNHPVSDPPVEHLADILRNAAVFHRRWGWWPMHGWLTAFREQGLIRYDRHTEHWTQD